MHQQVNCCKPANEFGQRCDSVISKTLIIKGKKEKKQVQTVIKNI